MASVNHTRTHCVNQMGKTHSKPLAARHGRGRAWARHVMCESAFIRCISVARVYRVIYLMNIVRHFLSFPLPYSRDPIFRTPTRAPEWQQEVIKCIRHIKRGPCKNTRHLIGVTYHSVVVPSPRLECPWPSYRCLSSFLSTRIANAENDFMISALSSHPYFIWQISCVTSRDYFAARFGCRLSEL